MLADDERLDRVAEAFALVIDAKSPYTYRHSTRVAELAVAAGSALGFDRRRAPRPAPRRAAARHRQARRPELDPRQAGAAHRRGAEARRTPPEAVRAGTPPRRTVRRHRSARRRPPREARRQRLLARGDGRRAPAAGTCPGGRRRLRGADRRPPVSRGTAARGSAGDPRPTRSSGASSAATRSPR